MNKFHIRLLTRKHIIRWWIYLCLVVAIFTTLTLIQRLPTNKEWSYSTQILAENNEFLRVYLDANQQWHLQFTGDIPVKLKRAVLEFEDKEFYRHPGINPLAIFRAIIQNLKEKRIVSGGSTITMQVARLYLRNERTLFNKLKEAFLSLKIELFYSKEDILLMYLNNAPYGSNIVGIASASYKYYGKKLEDLTWAEAALFAVLPNNPGYLYPGRNNEKLKRKRNILLKKLLDAGDLTEQQYQNSLLEEIPDKLYQFPLLAPHLSDKLKKQDNKVFNTTISKSIQQSLEGLLKKHSTYLSSIGIKNISLLVSDTKKHEVKAYIGSQDYFSTANRGYNDGIKALRSSASILKPFIYAYAFEKGIITPMTMLEDVNRNYGILLPKNFDKHYRGLIRADHALQKSLNIPAYEITKQLGIYNVSAVLQSVGMKSLKKDASSYGLSICVGGAETNLWDLSEMYQTLANEGYYHNLKIVKNESELVKQSMLSPAASYQVLDILKGVKRPSPFENKFMNTAWKTGTSNGFRDAWAVGVNPDWTIAVWAGNFTGEGNINLSGRNIAGYILFQVLNSLQSEEHSFFTKPLYDFKMTPICPVSGLAPTKSCHDTLIIEIPRNVSILPNCSYHKDIIVTLDESMEVCSNCWQGIERKKISVLDYPPDVDYYLKQEGKTFINDIPHNPKCSSLQQQSSLIVKYPINNSIIYLPKDNDGSLNSFQAEVFTSDNQVYWFLNEEFLGKTEKEHKFDIVTESGNKELLILTDLGAQKKVIFKIVRKDD